MLLGNTISYSGKWVGEREKSVREQRRYIQSPNRGTIGASGARREVAPGEVDLEVEMSGL